MKTLFTNLAQIEAQRANGGKLYQEFLRAETMSAGLYVLPAGAFDKQKPHREDEIYYVVRGRARMQAGSEGREDYQSEDREVNPGDLIFIAAQVSHRFYDIAEDLALLVLFAPAET